MCDPEQDDRPRAAPRHGGQPRESRSWVFLDHRTVVETDAEWAADQAFWQSFAQELIVARDGR